MLRSKGVVILKSILLTVNNFFMFLTAIIVLNHVFGFLVSSTM